MPQVLVVFILPNSIRDLDIEKLIIGSTLAVTLTPEIEPVALLLVSSYIILQVETSVFQVVLSTFVTPIALVAANMFQVFAIKIPIIEIEATAFCIFVFIYLYIKK
jgi:hypothetical protein